MRFLQSIGVDTPEEFVLLFLTVATEFFIGWMVVQGNMDHETLFMNPLVGYWLGKVRSNGNGNGNGHTPTA